MPCGIYLSIRPLIRFSLLCVEFVDRETLIRIRGVSISKNALTGLFLNNEKISLDIMRAFLICFRSDNRCGKWFLLCLIFFLDTGVTCVSFMFEITVVNFCFSDINSTNAILLLKDCQVSITISLRFFSLSFEQGDWPNNILVIQMSSTKFLFSTYPF